MTKIKVLLKLRLVAEVLAVRRLADALVTGLGMPGYCTEAMNIHQACLYGAV